MEAVKLDNQIINTEVTSKDLEDMGAFFAPYSIDLEGEEWCTPKRLKYLKAHWKEVKEEFCEELGRVYQSALNGACDTVLRKGGLL